MADRERNISNQVDTKFCIGSLNKMFTAAAIAQLVEQGRLSYDDLIRKYLGPVWILSEVGEKVKISHLLSHTSEIAEFLTDEFLISSAEIYRTLEDYKPIVKEKSLTFKPGTRWGYYLLALVSFWWIWANTMTTTTSLRFEKPKSNLTWIIAYPFGILIGLAYIV